MKFEKTLGRVKHSWKPIQKTVGYYISSNYLYGMDVGDFVFYLNSMVNKRIRKFLKKKDKFINKLDL